MKLSFFYFSFFFFGGSVCFSQSVNSAGSICKLVAMEFEKRDNFRIPDQQLQTDKNKTNTKPATAKKIPKTKKLLEAQLKMPQYPGGNDSIAAFLRRNLRYPESAKNAKIQGTVFLEFVIDAGGKIKDIVATKYPSKALADEAARVIKLMPKWKPARQNGKNLQMSWSLPVNFVL
ncbi:MAG: energy transducer TonB [Bacteroidia bacterium]|nr:energy transducer TonB [Bacteroidia bacterium]